jgi:hypothetical protein
MHLRLWAVGASALAVLTVPATAQASVGVGIQAGPVKLAGAAHPGGSYTLPAVLVVNTGTSPESVTLSIDRVSPGAGRSVPPSWVHATSTITLSATQSARIPLQLVVPPTAKPGRYFSDVLVKAGAPNPAGGATFDAGAATQLAFTVAPGRASTPWFMIPTWVFPGIGVVLLIAAGLGLMRRYGVRIRIEREPGAAGSLGVDTRHPARRRVAWFAMAVTLIALSGCGIAVPPGSSTGASITLTLHTKSDLRSAGVSPSKGTFTNCIRGHSGEGSLSTKTLMGFPNGICSFYPITVTNQGVPAHVEVYGSDASPANGYGRWTLCNLGAHPAVTCTGPGGEPGLNQYVLANFIPQGATYSAGLTHNLRCDHVFNASPGCWAGHLATALEGVKVTGPAATTDTSTTWMITVTWYAVPGSY